MIEYLRSDNAELQISFTAASGVTSVVFESYDLDSASFVQSGNTSSAASQVFNATFTIDSAQYDRNLKVDWVSSTASGASSTILYYSIKRPYATVSRIKELVDIDTTTVSDDTLKKYEKKARLFIEAYTGIRFTKEYDAIVQFGDNSDTLLMPTQVIKVNQIYEDDILVYDLASNQIRYEPSGNLITASNNKILSQQGFLSNHISVFIKNRTVK
jgi:hypothetical protein